MWVTYAGPCRTCGLYAPTSDDDGGNVTLPDALQHYLVAEELVFEKFKFKPNLFLLFDQFFGIKWRIFFLDFIFDQKVGK